MLKLGSLCHIGIGAEAYKAQTSLKQCYNCQNFVHVWANYKQPPVVYIVGLSPAKRNSGKGQHSINTDICNCKLVKGEEPHPSTIEVAGTPRKRCER
jgi:hypothetical protein